MNLNALFGEVPTFIAIIGNHFPHIAAMQGFKEPGFKDSGVLRYFLVFRGYLRKLLRVWQRITISQSSGEGADLRYDLKISFLEAAFGKDMEIEVPRGEACDRCDGLGVEPVFEKEVCWACGGQ